MTEPRRLGWRLRQSAQIEATTQGGNRTAFVQSWPTGDTSQDVTVELRLSLDNFVRIASAVDVGRDIAYPDESIELWAAWATGFVRAFIGGASVQTSENRHGGTIYISDEDSEDMRPFTLERDGNGYRLVYDCGCGDLLRFDLSLASGDSQGAGTVFPGGNSGGFPSNVPTLPVSSEDCYTGKASQIYTDIMTDFAQNVVGIIAAGFDFATVGDEVIEFAAAAVDLITGGNNYDSLVGVSDAAIASALSNYVATVAAEFPLGELQRADLQRLARLYPALDGVVPVGKIASTYAAFGNVRKLNASLAIVQAECASGTTGVFDQGIIAFASGGVNYELQRLNSAPVTARSGDGQVTLATPTNLANVVGNVTNMSVTGTGSLCGAGNPRMWFKQPASGAQFFSTGNLNNVAGTGGWQGSIPAGLQDDIESVLNMTFTDVGVGATANITLEEVLANLDCAGSNPATLQITYNTIYALVELP